MKISSQIFCDQNILPFSRWTKDISKAIPRFLIEEMLSPARWAQSEISVPQHEPTNPSPELTAQPKSLPKRSIPFSLNLSSNTLKALGSSAFAVAAIGTYFLLSRTGSSSLPIQQMSSGNDTPTAPVFSQPGHLENILSGPSPLPLSTSPWNDTPAAHTSVSSGIPDSELFLPSPLPTSPWKNQLVQSFSSPQLSALDQCPADKIAKNPISNQIAAVKKFFSKTFIYSNVCDYLWEKPKNFIWISFYEYGYNLF